MKTLRIRRDKGFYGIFRALKIIVDGEDLGRIRQGQSIEIKVMDDASEIWGQMDWASTDCFSLEGLEEGQTIVFKAYFSFNFSKTLGAGATMPFKVFVE